MQNKVDELKALQAEAERRGIVLKETGVFDDHPYNPGKLGWLLEVSYPVKMEVFGPHLTTAYKKLLGVK